MQVKLVRGDSDILTSGVPFPTFTGGGRRDLLNNAPPDEGREELALDHGARFLKKESPLALNMEQYRPVAALDEILANPHALSSLAKALQPYLLPVTMPAPPPPKVIHHHHYKENSSMPDAMPASSFIGRSFTNVDDESYDEPGLRTRGKQSAAPHNDVKGRTLPWAQGAREKQDATKVSGVKRTNVQAGKLAKPALTKAAKRGYP